MSILDKAVAHFDKLGIKKIKIPEWNSVIYSTPYTLIEKRKLLNFSKGDTSEFMARLLILKALDKDGKQVFDISDKPTLMGHTHAGIIERVVEEIAATISLKKVEEK